MKTFARRTAALVLALWPMLATASAAKDECFACHQALSDKPSALFHKDIHRQKGITCAGCHGGRADTDDMTAAMDSSAGFLGVPKGDAISRACANCHSSEERMKSLGSAVAVRQWESLQSSVHGKMVDAGGNHVVQCISCHDAHGILSTK
ncbi:ammonia-forming cytochrome c nitrite reductase subunit c552, partial [bacterium]